MKFREPVPIRTGPHSPKEKEKNSSQQQQQEAAAEAVARAHTDIDMSHSTPEQPTFGEHDESDSLPSDAIAAAELDDLRDRRVYAARLGCVCISSTSLLLQGRPAHSSWAHSARARGTSGKEITCSPFSASYGTTRSAPIRRARVAEAPKARLDFFCGADLFWGANFFSGAGEVVSMATPETMTKRRFLTHPFSTVA